MFWSKKEDKNQLPDIPQTKSFPIRREIPENDDDNEKKRTGCNRDDCNTGRYIVYSFNHNKT